MKTCVGTLLAALTLACADLPTLEPSTPDEPAKNDPDSYNTTESAMLAMSLTSQHGIPYTREDVERMGIPEARRLVTTLDIRQAYRHLVALRKETPEPGSPMAGEIDRWEGVLASELLYLDQLNGVWYGAEIYEDWEGHIAYMMARLDGGYPWTPLADEDDEEDECYTEASYLAIRNDPSVMSGATKCG